MKVTAEFNPTIRQLAEYFCELDDEKQAQFFIECAELAKSWSKNQSLGWDMQGYLVGNHLKTCSCSTWEARNMVEAIYHGINSKDNH